MVTFCISIVLLVLGYFLYGKFVERVFGVDGSRPTPATTMADGVDYVPMKPWRIFLIQFLNIAGVGPICGAIMGAQFGTASFIWIVFGSIFAGAVHDFLSGMMSLRDKGCSLPELHGKHLGNGAKQFMRGFSVIMLILVGVVFVNTPATLLNNSFTPNWNIYIWVILILAYYLIATLLPIDKLIGRIYPIFGFLLIGMAIAIIIAFIVYRPAIPEIWDGLQNRHPEADTNPIFPMMFVSIACGAISGFHATQSPLMARCMINEKQGRPIFYGSMITEGIVALIWAAAATYFFDCRPELCEGQSGNSMVRIIANTWFSPVFATITILGVISAAITSGDTALRSARLIVADFLRYDQKSIKNRLHVAIPLFAIVGGMLIFSVTSKEGFDIIWRYFAWANQVLAMVTLWTISVYLIKNQTKKWHHIITLIPAMFMTFICMTFISLSKIGLNLPVGWSYNVGLFTSIGSCIWFYIWANRYKKSNRII